MQGNDRENKVEEILEEKINNWRAFQPFLTGLDRRTERCMGKITAQFDSSTWKKKMPGMQIQEFDPIKTLAKAQLERESMYYGSQFKGLLEKIKSNSKGLKISMIREALKDRLIQNMIYCFHRSRSELGNAVIRVDSLCSLCPRKDLETVDKLFFMNVHFADFYTSGKKTQNWTY